MRVREFQNGYRGAMLAAILAGFWVPLPMLLGSDPFLSTPNRIALIVSLTLLNGQSHGVDSPYGPPRFHEKTLNDVGEQLAGPGAGWCPFK